VSKEEAFEYLKLRKIDEEQAAQIYELVGGRMIHLKSITDDILESNDTLEGMCTTCYAENKFLTAFIAIRKSMFSKAESQLESAQILRTGCYHKEGGVIVCELLKRGSISRRTFFDLVGRDTGNKLLETNIFAYHLNPQEITFQSTVMKRYCEENSAVWEGK
jgi:hypothetical protein